MTTLGFTHIYRETRTQNTDVLTRRIRRYIGCIICTDVLQIGEQSRFTALSNGEYIIIRMFPSRVVNVQN